MTIKKYYNNGKLASVGFDSLEEVFVFRNNKLLLTEISPVESYLGDNERKELHSDPKFLEFIEKMKKGEDEF